MTEIILETDTTTDPDIIEADRSTVLVMIENVLADPDIRTNLIEFGTGCLDIGGYLEDMSFVEEIEGEYEPMGAFWVGLADHMKARADEIVKAGY